MMERIMKPPKKCELTLGKWTGRAEALLLTILIMVSRWILTPLTTLPYDVLMNNPDLTAILVSNLD